MSTLRSALLLFLSLALLSVCGSCSSGPGSSSEARSPAAVLSAAGSAAPSPEQPVTDSFFAMDTFMDLAVYGDPSLPEEIRDLVSGLEDRLSVTREDSEIAAVNRDGQGTLSSDTAALVAAGLDLCRRTDGALDLSIYPVLKTWGFTTGQYHVPSSEELEPLLEHVDWTGVHLEEEAGFLALDPGLEMDLGSIAKGYTGDRILERLRERGVSSALLNLGGNVQTLGTKPDGSMWQIALRDPMSQGNLGVLSVADRAVITSGGYERFFEEDGQIYWHILDPATGCPARSGLLSVTVVGERGVVCDGLSTALFVMGTEKAVRFWQESDDFEAILVTDDGRVCVTEGLADSFTLLEPFTALPLEVIARE